LHHNFCAPRFANEKKQKRIKILDFKLCSAKACSKNYRAIEVVLVKKSFHAPRNLTPPRDREIIVVEYIIFIFR
jgi:hypothetical protein